MVRAVVVVVVLAVVVTDLLCLRLWVWWLRLQD